MVEAVVDADVVVEIGAEVGFDVAEGGTGEDDVAGRAVRDGFAVEGRGDVGAAEFAVVNEGRPVIEFEGFGAKREMEEEVMVVETFRDGLGGQDEAAALLGVFRGFEGEAEEFLVGVFAPEIAEAG